MRRSLPLLIAAAATVLLAGCSGGPGASSTPTPTAATTQQVASVLAAHVTDLRTLADDGNDCAVAMAGLTGNQALALDCLSRAQQASTDAGSITTRWAALTVPTELTDLVTSTGTELDSLGAADLTGPCGSDFANARDQSCVDAIAGWNATLKRLAPQLDAWSPYL